LRELIKQYSSKSLVYIDEAGFSETEINNIYAWSKKGKKVYDSIPGKRKKRENLITGRRNKEKDLIAPIILTGSIDAKTFEQWLEIYLIPNLNIPSVLIMDNAAIHRKKIIKEIGEKTGHEVLFLPTYSLRS
jgi:putative transposase